MWVKNKREQEKKIKDIEYMLANTPHLTTNNEFEYNNLQYRLDTLNQKKIEGAKLR